MKQIIMIAAMSRDRIIGNLQGDGMPWNVPEEFQHFLALVRDKAIIMGRKSFEIFKGDMSGCAVFVVSHQTLRYPNATVCPDIESAITLAGKTHNEIFVAGGEAIYNLALPYANGVFLSTIYGAYEGMNKFPFLPAKEWTLESKVEHPRFIFQIFRRTAKASTL